MLDTCNILYHIRERREKREERKERKAIHTYLERKCAGFLALNSVMSEKLRQ
jgi:hypothetical protein